MLSNHLILCCPLLPLPSDFPSIRVFSEKLALPNRWPKYGSFSFSISPSNEHSGLISFRIDQFDLFVVQGTFKSSPTPQFKGVNSSALSLFYNPTLTFVHSYSKNHQFSSAYFSRSVLSDSFCPMDCSTHGFDYTDLCGQSVVSAF